MANGGWSTFGALGTNAMVGGLANELVGGIASRGCNNTAVAGIFGAGPFCFGPPTFAQKLAAMRGVPVCVCTENSRCVHGQIMEICFDYITLNVNGSLEIIPIEEITRVSLAPSFGGNIGVV